MQPNNSEPVVAQPMPERFAALINGPLPVPESMSSTDRIATVTTARDAIKAGFKLPEPLLKVLITLITIDRTEAAKAARSAGATAKKASKVSAAQVEGAIAKMSDEDAADAL